MWHMEGHVGSYGIKICRPTFVHKHINIGFDRRKFPMSKYKYDILAQDVPLKSLDEFTWAATRRTACGPWDYKCETQFGKHPKTLRTRWLLYLPSFYLSKHRKVEWLTIKRMISSNVGSVVEFSPATREARVRFPDVASFWKFHFLKCIDWEF